MVSRVIILSPILQVMIISDLVTEFLGSEPGFDSEFSDCHLIKLHQTLPVKYMQHECLGARDGEGRRQIVLQWMTTSRWLLMYIFIAFMVNSKVEGPFSPLTFISENLKNYTYYVDEDIYICMFLYWSFTKDNSIKTKQQRPLPLGLLLAEPTLSHYILGPLWSTQDREFELGSRPLLIFE